LYGVEKKIKINFVFVSSPLKDDILPIESCLIAFPGLDLFYGHVKNNFLIPKGRTWSFNTAYKLSMLKNF
jgi:hypothetical protein